MVKWADYLISEVSYDPSHLILKIKQHTDNGKTISLGEVVDRNTLVDNLGHGAKYMTLYNALEKVRIGKNVRYFRAYEHHYIRTDKNKVTSDNLGDLPQLEKLDHEEVQDIVDRLMKLLSQSVEKFGGYVDKYSGDEIMALFGAKVASEVDTERAIRAGLQMLNNLKGYNHYLKKDKKYGSSIKPLAIRIGINTGLVTTGKIGKGREGDFTVYGDAVNLASRLESSAPIR